MFAPKALLLNCTLKRSHSPSSTEKLLTELLAAFRQEGATGSIVRVADLNILPGVTPDEGPGDDWPAIRRQIVESDILVIGTPIWVGQPSSIAKRVLERMDAFLEEADEQGQMPSFGKVAAAAVVGNEDGAHHCHAELFQALNDVGFTIPAVAGTYWVGEAMGSTDYVDLTSPFKKTQTTTRMVARHATHLARLLMQSGYPGD